ncbi:hypothetical protein UFOVP87_9 [uncultured Caudovirales phage]|uniref:Uncharacterized protein n=1 Tax=uncultured Caudovirales phage TaxID=2100421 RepID=A0A6J5KW21_9CAUD|nr:hypothetical protein UFOVP87_9 [uncultured Caudovirales phage]
MENQNEVIKGQLSEEEVTALVTKYPKSYAAVFENEQGENVCVYLKKIEREVFVQGNKFMSSKDELTTCEYLLKNIWIAGYPVEDILKDFDALKNCAATIIPVLFVKAGELKKN